MKSQLVIQFFEKIYGNLDWIADLEVQIDNSLVDAQLYGHDIGSGEVNMFIETNAPTDSFEAVINILNKQKIALVNIEAGYKEFNDDTVI